MNKARDVTVCRREYGGSFPHINRFAWGGNSDFRLFNHNGNRCAANVVPILRVHGNGEGVVPGIDRGRMVRGIPGVDKAIYVYRLAVHRGGGGLLVFNRTAIIGTPGQCHAGNVHGLLVDAPHVDGGGHILEVLGMDGDGDGSDFSFAVALHRLNGQGEGLAVNHCAAGVVAAQIDRTKLVGDGGAAQAHALRHIGPQSAQAVGVGMLLLVGNRQIAGLGGEGRSFADGHAGRDRFCGPGHSVILRVRAGEGHCGQGEVGIGSRVGAVQGSGQAGGINGYIIAVQNPGQRHAGDLHRIGAVIGPALRRCSGGGQRGGKDT